MELKGPKPKIVLHAFSMVILMTALYEGSLPLVIVWAGYTLWVTYATAPRHNHELDEGSVAPRKVERWSKYDLQWPIQHDSDHDMCWTAADGVWHCRTCGEWYRTWKEEPRRPTLQDIGKNTLDTEL